MPTGVAGTGAQKVAVLESSGVIAVRHAKVPEPGPAEVRVRVLYVGICGSDLEAFRGSRAPEFMATPSRLGHEVAGVLDMGER
jgi:L-iditol 2-dehydrogenase